MIVMIIRALLLVLGVAFFYFITATKDLLKYKGFYKSILFNIIVFSCSLSCFLLGLWYEEVWARMPIMVSLIAFVFYGIYVHKKVIVSRGQKKD